MYKVKVNVEVGVVGNEQSESESREVKLDLELKWSYARNPLPRQVKWLGLNKNFKVRSRVKPWELCCQWDYKMASYNQEESEHQEPIHSDLYCEAMSFICFTAKNRIFFKKKSSRAIKLCMRENASFCWFQSHFTHDLINHGICAFACHPLGS